MANTDQNLKNLKETVLNYGRIITEIEHGTTGGKIYSEIVKLSTITASRNHDGIKA